MAYTAIPNSDVDVASPVSTALITALRDNTVSVGEADASLPNELRPTQLLGTLTTTSGTTQTLSSLDLTNFRGLWVVVVGVSHDNISSRILRIAGAAASGLFSSGVASGVSIDAYISIDLISGQGFSIGGIATGTESPIVSSWIRPQITNATTSIVFSWNGAGNFDAGTIRIYGRK